MEARDAGRFGQVPSAASAERAPAAGSVPPWYRRVAFWRAVAGMALAIAIACAAVAAEFSSELLARTRRYHNRLRQLSSNIIKMRGEIASADREIAGMRIAVEADDNLRRILAEPDARLIRLAAPGRAAQPSGVIAFSAGLRRAAIEIAGLPAPPGGLVYDLWWICGKRGPLKAARLSIGAGGKAALVIALPADGETIDSASVIADPSATIVKPAGDTILSGVVAPARAPSESPRHKNR